MHDKVEKAMALTHIALEEGKVDFEDARTTALRILTNIAPDVDQPAEKIELLKSMVACFFLLDCMVDAYEMLYSEEDSQPQEPDDYLHMN